MSECACLSNEALLDLYRRGYERAIHDVARVILRAAEDPEGVVLDDLAQDVLCIEAPEDIR